MTTRAHQIDTMVCLVGEQPIPNLLPILHYQINSVVLVCTDVPKSRTAAANLARILLHKNRKVLLCTGCPSYDFIAAIGHISQFVVANQLTGDSCLYNITGGTKPMSIAAHQVASANGAPTCYLDSDKQKNYIYEYDWSNGNLALLDKIEISGDLLDIHDHLMAFGHLQTAKVKAGAYPILSGALSQLIPSLSDKNYINGPPRGKLEEAIFDSLASIEREFEVMKNANFGFMEMDVLLRRRNQVGHIEIKGLSDIKEKNSGEKEKPGEAIKQSIAASEQRFLGTFVKRFVVLHKKDGEINEQIMAYAKFYNIKVIHLRDPHESGLSSTDHSKLTETIKREMST